MPPALKMRQQRVPPSPQQLGARSPMRGVMSPHARSPPSTKRPPPPPPDVPFALRFVLHAAGVASLGEIEADALRVLLEAYHSQGWPEVLRVVAASHVRAVRAVSALRQESPWRT